MSDSLHGCEDQAEAVENVLYGFQWMAPYATL
jgi:hypothetical protein